MTEHSGLKWLHIMFFMWCERTFWIHGRIVSMFAVVINWLHTIVTIPRVTHLRSVPQLSQSPPEKTGRKHDRMSPTVNAIWWTRDEELPSAIPVLKTISKILES